MNEEIRKEIEDFAKEKSKIETEGDYDFFSIHVESVRQLCLQLAEIENADKEVLEIASLLHDIGYSVQNEGHAKISRTMAEPFLEKYNLEKIELILDCIEKHGKEYISEENPIEIKIIQAADALSLFYNKKGIEKMMKEKGKEEVLSFFKKKSNKITIESGKRIFEELFNQLKEKLK